ADIQIQLQASVETVCTSTLRCSCGLLHQSGGGADQIGSSQCNARDVPFFVVLDLFHQRAQFDDVVVVHARLFGSVILLQLRQTVFQLIQITFVVLVLALGFFQLFLGVFQAFVGFHHFHGLVLYHQAHFAF